MKQVNNLKKHFKNIKKKLNFSKLKNIYLNCKIQNQDQWLQELKEKDLNLGMDTKTIYHRLKKKEEICKFKL